ncbi:MAG: hypothetical protein PUE90_08905 [Bacteroidales bacterium]|nr:hypothetical protein [Bacteroidales bacterium]
MKHLLTTALLFTLISCAPTESRQPAAQAEPSHRVPADTLVTVLTISVESTDFIQIRLNPANAYIAVADSVMPSESDPTIGLCVEAAFTGELLPEFKTDNVAGDYVVEGKLRKGYKCKANTGFLYADKTSCTISSSQNCNQWIGRAQKTQGSLFQQMLLVKAGANVYQGKPIRRSSANIYRSACKMKDGSFAVIQTKTALSLEQFIKSLIAMGVQDALYLDMGSGWNYGWYRTTTDSAPVRLFNYRTPYQTNWLVIKRRK